jgi:hypothetical protein
MSECSEHRGKYLHEAACLKCLSLYWEMQYKAQRTKVAELEAKLAAMFDIEESWDKCNIDEQECLNRILGVLHFKEQSGHE